MSTFHHKQQDTVQTTHPVKTFFLVQLPFIILYITTLCLVALTEHDFGSVKLYWQMFILCIALVSILSGWHSAGTGRQEKSLYVLKQLMHWGVTLVMIRLLYTHDFKDFLDNELAGFIMLYVMGLSAMLAGIHSDWKIGVFGIFLTLSALSLGWLEDNTMLLTVVSIIAVIGIVLTLMLKRTVHTSTPSTPDGADDSADQDRELSV